MNLGKMLDETCRLFPERTALIYDDKTLTYKELKAAVDSLTRRLHDLGIRKDDKVALMLPNVPEFVISYFAALKLGAVVVTLSTQSTSHELDYLLKNSDSRILITTGQLSTRVDPIRKDLPLLADVLITEGMGESSPFMDAVEAGPSEIDRPEVGGDDPAVMIYTAGLTGKPLGAVLTHNALLTQGDLLRHVCDGDENDRALAVIPLFHAFGASANMLNALKTGAGLVLMDVFNIDSLFKTVMDLQVTYIAAVPRIFLGMILHPTADKYKLKSLRLCITGGSAMPPEFIPLFEQKFGVPLREGYGLTEAAPICTLSRVQSEGRPGSIGTVIPGVEAKIVDGQDREVPIGEAGELLVKGVNVMKGYYKDGEATEKVIRNGWLYTGDLAKMDKDGYIYLTGRKKRMVITSGFNVYPREVEMILRMHPAVKEAKVVGKLDMMRGEVVRALIVRKNGESVDEKSILRHCRTYLSSYKVPRVLEFVESLD
ncbi:MAG TPA: AMP-binding protein [Syntrophales bacterium]|nr:AMP-binding protein [Syntrophales bacterium]